MKKNKRGIVLDFTGWLILAVILLVVSISVYFVLSGKTSSLIEYMRDIFRFR